MDAPTRPKRQFKLANYPFQLTDNVRYGDLDPNKHVNNAVYATYFETTRVTLLRSGDRGRPLAEMTSRIAQDDAVLAAIDAVRRTGERREELVGPVGGGAHLTRDRRAHEVCRGVALRRQPHRHGAGGEVGVRGHPGEQVQLGVQAELEDGLDQLGQEAALTGQLDIGGKTVVVVASGGNVDPTVFTGALAA